MLRSLEQNRFRERKKVNLKDVNEATTTTSSMADMPSSIGASASGTTILGEPVSASNPEPTTTILEPLSSQDGTLRTTVLGDPVSQAAPSSSSALSTSPILSSAASHSAEPPSSSSSLITDLMTSSSPSAPTAQPSSSSVPSEHRLLIALLVTFGTLILLLFIFGLGYLARRYRRKHHSHSQLRILKTRSPHNLAAELDGGSVFASSLISSSGPGTVQRVPLVVAAAAVEAITTPASAALLAVELPG
jgi:hypothetical protein